MITKFLYIFIYFINKVYSHLSFNTSQNVQESPLCSLNITTLKKHTSTALQQRLHELASMLYYTHIVCLILVFKPT